MKSKDFQFTTKKRRGLSSVVGALIFVVLMVATFAVLGVALDSQTLIVDTSRTVADTGLKKQQENFIVTSALQPPSEPLQIKATNLGQNSAEIFTLIITNSSDEASGYPTKTYEIPSDTSFLPPNPDVQTDIVKTLNLTLAITPDGLTETYDLKMISSLGTIKRLQIVCNDTFCGAGGGTGTGDIVAQMFLDGPTGVNTKTTTVIMFVTNTGELPLTDVAPDFGNPTPDCDNMWAGPAGADVSPCDLDTIPIIVDLGPFQTWMYKWDGKISGAVDDGFLFCNSATGTLPDFSTVNTGLVCDDLTVIDPNDCGGCEEGGPGGDPDPLSDEFITRPELFLIIPSPFGSPGNDPTGPDAPPPPNDGARALWGANVVNPTETTMLIHKITITAFAPASNDNINIIGTAPSDKLACLPRDLSPGNGTIPGTKAQEAGFWSCPGSNTIMWKNYANPIELPPHSVFPFLVKLQSNIGGTNDVESVLVDSTVFTTSGSFGKGNYQTTYYSDGMYANIYESDTPQSFDLTEIHSERRNIMSNSTETFHINLAEFDFNDSTFINAGSKIVVNVPRAFMNVTVLNATSFKILEGAVGIEPSVVEHPDGTIQIIAELSENIGDVESIHEAATLSFTARAPTVTTKQLMVMYTLVNGVGSNDNSVGALAELILQVDPFP